ncbi:MAG: Rpn family recombination-promoting nuclease/putative transposase [Lachnospiraceae bacterium]|nr:Rpn family recombination-promoting nuclease/putative transposase [Lachnospiraceae bacterium]
MNQIELNQSNFDISFQNATGKIPYNMINDYMFRAVLQKNNHVLRGLICSLLHLEEQEVISVDITNPIILGKALEDKEFRLDINVLLNDNTYINLEMQITNKLNWQNRSISYLCRSFDQLHHGQNYSEAKAVIHIGFLDYTLFPDHPEFYATYKLMNVKNQHIYSDNLTLSMVDLTQINLATDEDRSYHIDQWAALFKAKTWEEIKMLAEKNEYLNEASKTMFQLSADEQIKKRCRDREEYYQDLRAYEKAIAEKDVIISNITSENERLRAEIETLKKQTK